MFAALLGAVPCQADALSEQAALTERGAALAAIGNCAGCHTRNAEPPFSGGVPLHTPYGTIFGSNITPDRDTGIGAWSESDFIRAMRIGIAKDGSHLYPAFPYDHFTLASNDDLKSLYAFIMTRTAVRRTADADQLDFPFNQRALMTAWNALYLSPGPAPAPSPDPASRGAYLARSLGHCDSCHSPRGWLGEERRDLAFEGGKVDGWYAPALNRHSPSPTIWTRQQMVQYLTTGIAPEHAMAAGPMRDVVQSLARADRVDVEAIADYVVDMMSSGNPQKEMQSEQRHARARAPLGLASSASTSAQIKEGEQVYQGGCASCHDRGRMESSQGALPMPLAIAAYDPDPGSLLHLIREGIAPIPGGAARFMPAFGASLSDAQLTALAAFIRQQGAHLPPWPDLEQAVKDSDQ
jgi:mono/diheme cytochrome c family protein